MTGPSSGSVVAVRNAVRDGLRDLERGALVLVACSGGADSLALAAGLAFVAPRMGLRAGAVTVDHGLQPGSASRAEAVAATLREVGLDPVRVVSVAVGSNGGLEAAARDARYRALADVAAKEGAAAVLLGHTLDDQAETVLLGLARGSGPRSLAGMVPVRGIFRRPLLGLRRAVTAEAAAGLNPWQDPHNTDRGFARVRVRLDALPALEAALGPGIAEALARTATQLRADNEVLDNLASETDPGDAGQLAAQPEAIRTRLLRQAALAAGCPPGSLTAQHIAWLDALLTDWHGQRWVDLPGGVRAVRRSGQITFEPVSEAAGAVLPGLRSDERSEERRGKAAPQSARSRANKESRARREIMDQHDMGPALKEVLVSEEQLRARIKELAARIDADYAGCELLLVGVLKGAVMVMADLAREMHLPVEMDWMAVSSYGSGTKSSGVVRILKDLDTDISGRHVLIVEDVVDSGLTLSWLVGNLRSRNPASVAVCAMLRKPAAATMEVDVAYTGFDIGNEFVIGYGLDYAQKYRNLPFIGTLAPHVYGA